MQATFDNEALSFLCVCVFLIEWVLAVHARYSGGVRLGNLMLDSHLLGPHTSSTPDYCITDPSRKSS